MTDINERVRLQDSIDFHEDRAALFRLRAMEATRTAEEYREKLAALEAVKGG